MNATRNADFRSRTQVALSTCYYKTPSTQRPTSLSCLLVACYYLLLLVSTFNSKPRAPWPLLVPGATGSWQLAATGQIPVARMVPIGPWCLQSGFSILRHVRRDFRKKKTGPRAPRPPGGTPATHQPAPGGTQGNVSRQLAGAVVLGGGGAAPAPTRGTWGRFCVSSIRVA
jgi:hypothetical protein